MTRICAYSKCEVEFETKRPHHRFHCESCRYWHHVEERENSSPNALQPSSEHPLVEARGQQEEGASADYLLLAREQICRTLLATGFFTADDLAPLDIPEQYRRSVHGSATGYFSGEEPFMEEVGRRKSERPERKGGKNTIFRITAKGRLELRGLLQGMEGPAEDAGKRLYGRELTAQIGAGSPSGKGEGFPSRPGTVDMRVARPDLGEPQRRPTGVPISQELGRATNPPVPSASDKTGESPAVTSHVAGDSARLFEIPPERPGHDREAWAA